MKSKKQVDQSLIFMLAVQPQEVAKLVCAFKLELLVEC